MARNPDQSRPSRNKSNNDNTTKAKPNHDGILTTNDIVAGQANAADVGAIVHFVGPRVGMFTGASGKRVEADQSTENSPGVLFDALFVPDGSEAIQALAGNALTIALIGDVFMHGETILALGTGQELLKIAGVGPVMDKDPGIILADSADVSVIMPAFIKAIAAHRHISRDSDPPMNHHSPTVGELPSHV